MSRGIDSKAKMRFRETIGVELGTEGPMLLLGIGPLLTIGVVS